MMDFNYRYEEMLKEIESLIKITNKRSVLILLQHTKEEEVDPYVPAVRESISNIIGFVSLGDDSYLSYMMEKAVGIIDTVMMDVDAKRSNSFQICDTVTRLAREKGIPIAYYSNYSSCVASALAFMLEIERREKTKNVYNSKRLLLGRNVLATKMVIEMISRGMDVYLFGKEYESYRFLIPGGEIEIRSSYIHVVENLSNTQFDVLIGCELQKRSRSLDSFSQIKFRYIYDIGIGNFSHEFVRQQREDGAEVFRSDDRAGISGIVVNLMETSELVGSRLGKTEIGGIPIVSGGYYGDAGDIVVDNFNDAHVVLGVANGDGTFKKELSIEEEDCIKRIEKLL